MATTADHRRLLPDDPPEREGAAALPRRGRPGARRDRPVLRLPVLRRRPGGVGAGHQAAARPGHAARLDQRRCSRHPTWRRGTGRSPPTWRGWNASSSRPRRRSRRCGRCSTAPCLRPPIEFRTIPAVTALAVARGGRRGADVMAWGERCVGRAGRGAGRHRAGRRPGPSAGCSPATSSSSSGARSRAFVPVQAVPAPTPPACDAGRQRPAARDPGIEAAVAVHEGASRRSTGPTARSATVVAERAIGVDGPIREYYLVGFDTADGRTGPRSAGRCSAPAPPSCSNVSQAHGSEGGTTVPQVTRVGRVVVPVSDQDKAIAFYTQVLGFTLVADMPFGDGYRWVEVAPPRRGRECGVRPDAR